MEEKQYYAPLDGLRSVAIILVMLLHAHFQLGKGGEIGVQVFFVLSGLLITQSLFNQYDKYGFISLKKFWIQRCFRLMPAFFMMLFFVFLISFLLYTDGRIRFIQWEIFNALFNISNISWFWQTENYEKILGHTWTLSVENQFYLIWPILLTLFIKYHNERKYVYSFTILIIFLGIVKVFPAIPDLFRAIYFESIYLGCILSIMLRNKWIISFNFPVLSFISFLLLILLGVFKLDYQEYLFHYKLVNLLVSFLTLFILLNSIFNPYSFLSLILSSRILVFIGKISYGLYLWHLPIFRIFSLSIILSPSFTFILKFLITFLFALMSYYLIEIKAIKYYKNHFSQ